MTVDVALAASAREWPDRVHRHVLDYGGARIVGRLMGAAQCLDDDFDVVFVDDVCSFLTPRLVTLLRQRGRVVIGVFDPVDSADAKRRLLECGISDVIESNAPADEFLARALSASADMPPIPAPRVVGGVGSRAVGVVGVSDGVGATEVAVGLAACASLRTTATLVDLDPTWPSVAQRLDLAPHPNLRTVIDVTLHGGDFDRAFQEVGSLRVVGGSVSDGSATPIPAHEVAMVLGAIAERSRVLTADLGAVERLVASVVEGFDAVILVCTADPVGLTRMIRTRERLTEVVDPASVLVAVNRTPRRRFFRSEIRSELSEALDGSPFVLLPFEESLSDSTWDGRPASRGPFVRELERIADLVVGAAGR